jgi:hypothetical protein
VNAIHVSSNNLASTCRKREYFYQDGTMTMHVLKENTSLESVAYAKGKHMHQL